MAPNQATLLTDRWCCGVCGVGSEKNEEREKRGLRGAASGEKTYTDCSTQMVSNRCIDSATRKFAWSSPNIRTGETSTVPERMEVIQTSLIHLG